MKDTYTHFKIYLLSLAVLSPVYAFADILGASTFKGTIQAIVSVIGIINPILFALAFIVFFWGISKFILSSGSPADIEKGRSYMLWGILALFVLVTSEVLIELAYKELEFGNDRPTVPGVYLPTRP